MNIAYSHLSGLSYPALSYIYQVINIELLCELLKNE